MSATTSAGLDEAQTALRTAPVADLGGLLKPGGRREVETAIERLAAQGLRARVLVVPQGAALSAWHPLWQRLALGPSDLLLLFNGHRWEARGWGLRPDQVQRALIAADSRAAPYYGRRLVNALEALAAARPGARPPAAETPVAVERPAQSGGGVLSWVAGAGGLVALTGLGLMIARRQRLARERHRSLDQARAAAEQVFAEVVLAAEEMPEAEGAALRERASRLHGELGALPSGQQQKALPPREQTINLARFGQIENELEALRSVVLQRKQRR